MQHCTCAAQCTLPVAYSVACTCMVCVAASSLIEVVGRERAWPFIRRSATRMPQHSYRELALRVQRELATPEWEVACSYEIATVKWPSCELAA
jgi:hypothetical protein